ncbi:cytochrome P450 [Pseudenhygromyxa sp. WMMC2535]|uniref:cytochrome P450 n=1 Tax=Pseudenhygromyxa sp. WMMC2535 TaxID=2712867 RepID=UPI001553ABD4|nr:cytochrome P450 [Pseudenhygromyxa sp. WMMC2535]NVB36284.1 cytochrome P450 [Pseudenhygromyxa sp. WMMC2535]
MQSVVEDSKQGCPFATENTDSKTAAAVARRFAVNPDYEQVQDFEHARKVLLDKGLLQAGAGAEFIDKSRPELAPVFYLDGPEHLARRTAIARYFTPKTITSRYHAIIERETARLLGQLRRDGRAHLDISSFELTVAVAANIVGLTNSDVPKMARRLAILLAGAGIHKLGPIARVATQMRRVRAIASFYINDVVPAVRARRSQPQDDIISQLLEKDASWRVILTECMTYAGAGMVTTREFIVVAAWHLLDDPALREDFLDGDEDRQFAILNEILRLEPIATLLHRRTPKDTEHPEGHTYALDLRSIHLDEAAVGPCPLSLDPDRAAQKKANAAYLNFGVGAHHCPGKQVALHETRMFLDALLRVPGIRLERAPDVGWSEALESYELRDAIVVCDRA